ncbi:methionine import ATP-binding protein MetN [Arthrobacter sp. Hiyo8]|nr:methionine import ATP-binding protein MetN [Arthrobacter sp. Hiyo8]
MIEATGLRKVYGAKTAVDGISFTVQPGKVTGFLGPNGAGKSTTMRMIMGLDRPTSGDVIVNGRHYSQHNARSTKWERCSMPRRCTRAAVRTTTCAQWQRPTGFQTRALRKSSR